MRALFDIYLVGLVASVDSCDASGAVLCVRSKGRLFLFLPSAAYETKVATPVAKTEMVDVAYAEYVYR